MIFIFNFVTCTKVTYPWNNEILRNCPRHRRQTRWLVVLWRTISFCKAIGPFAIPMGHYSLGTLAKDCDKFSSENPIFLGQGTDVLLLPVLSKRHMLAFPCGEGVSRLLDIVQFHNFSQLKFCHSRSYIFLVVSYNSNPSPSPLTLTSPSPLPLVLPLPSF